MTIDPTVVVAAITALSAGLGAVARLVYSDMKKDRDFWRDTALAALRHADRAIDEKRVNGG